MYNKKNLSILSAFGLAATLTILPLTAHKTRTTAAAKSNANTPYWDHNPQSPHGPHNWHKLHHEWKKCNSQPHRSPIIIPQKTVPISEFTADNPPPFRVVNGEYDKVPTRVLDTGHGYQIPCENSGYIDLELYDENDKPYTKRFFLDQFHHHAQAEHPKEEKDEASNGIKIEKAEIELHFVHHAEDGERTVIAIMIDEGEHNPELNKIIDAITGKKADNLDLNKFINIEHGYGYDGSLTTPHKHEEKKTHWCISKIHLTGSLEQIEAIREKHGQNTRPPQPREGRPVFEF